MRHRGHKTNEISNVGNGQAAAPRRYSNFVVSQRFKRIAVLFLAFGIALLKLLSRDLTISNVSSNLMPSFVQQKVVIDGIDTNKTNATNNANFNSSNKNTAQKIVNDIVQNDNITNVMKQMVNVDLVVYLTGELGNHLHKIMSGKIMQLIALEDGRFNFTLRYLSQGLPKSSIAIKEVHKCFSKHFSLDKVNLKEWEENTYIWKQIVQNQSTIVASYFTDWDDPSRASKMLTIKRKGIFEDLTIESIHSILNHLEEVTKRMKNPDAYPLIYQNESAAQVERQQNVTGIGSLSLPFLLIDAWPPNSLSDRYWNDLHELLTFNEKESCKERPDVDETVLHIRGFTNELSAWGDTIGFRELSPNQTAYQFLGHLKSGEKVAIIGRPSEEELQHFTQALRNRGLQVRFVKRYTGTEDFCFLKTATKEIAGNEKSTFFRNAALLSDTVKSVTMSCFHYPPTNVCDKKTTEFANNILTKKSFVMKIF